MLSAPGAGLYYFHRPWERGAEREPEPLVEVEAVPRAPHEAVGKIGRKGGGGWKGQKGQVPFSCVSVSLKHLPLFR